MYDVWRINVHSAPRDNLYKMTVLTKILPKTQDWLKFNVCLKPNEYQMSSRTLHILFYSATLSTKVLIRPTCEQPWNKRLADEKTEQNNSEYLEMFR